ncbi:hypothetical protein HGA64_05075 [Candidatus Falkowbacteria bacterium]|nr:hypothetical protein [Candidatus Falkowbacteria bacterium]
MFRSDEPIFEPAEDYEMSGMVDVLPGGLKGMQKMLESELKEFLAAADKDGTMPRVTFCCGAVVVDGVLRIYYGASDSVICTASAMMDDVLGLVKY